MGNVTPGSERTKSRGLSYRVAVVLWASLFGIIGLAACSAAEDVISFVEYIGATGEVLEANGIEGGVDIDCEGSTETKNVTCTATTSDGRSVESRGENLGEDTATLVVTVDGQTLYDGLLKDAPSS